MTSERTTKKQQLLLEFVRSFIDEHAYGPSYREIMAGLNYKSVSTVAVHVEALITKGFLERTDGSIRSLKVVGAKEVTAHGASSSAETEIRELIKTLSADETRIDDIKTLIQSLKLLGYSVEEYQKAFDGLAPKV